MSILPQLPKDHLTKAGPAAMCQSTPHGIKHVEKDGEETEKGTAMTSQCIP